jgi:hypothetical protein
MHLGSFVNQGTVGWICTARPRVVTISVTPPKQLFINTQETLTVVITPPHADVPPHLTQSWRNGRENIFSNDRDDVNEVIQWLKVAQQKGRETDSFIFSGAFDGERANDPRVLSIDIPLKGFEAAHGLQTPAAR